MCFAVCKSQEIRQVVCFNIAKGIRNVCERRQSQFVEKRPVRAGVIAGYVVGGSSVTNIDFTAFVIGPVGVAADHFACGILHVNPIDREVRNGVRVCEGIAESYKSAWKTGVGFIDVAPDVVGV